MSYADPYGWPTYIPYGAADFGRSTYDRGGGYSPRGRHDRGFFERAGDEVLSWFGDEDAQRRRERDHRGRGPADYVRSRSEEHTSELQSLMRHSYAVVCLQKKQTHNRS